MSTHCQVTGRRPGFGKSVSHSHRRTNRRWDPNIQRKTYYLPSEGRRITLTVSAKASRPSTATVSRPSWRGCAARGSNSDGRAQQRDSPHREAPLDRGHRVHLRHPKNRRNDPDRMVLRK